MREIKFRTWNGDRVSYLLTAAMGRESCINSWFRLFDGSPKENIMQYIGIEDAKGNDVYEGDILVYGHYMGVVEYNPDTLSYILRRPNKTFIRLEVIKSSIEIVGNIYANPELLTPVNKQ